MAQRSGIFYFFAARLLLAATLLPMAIVYFSLDGRAAEPSPPANLEVVTTDPASVRAFLESLGFERYVGISSRERRYGKEFCDEPAAFLGVFSYPKPAGTTSALMVCVTPTLPTLKKALGFCKMAQAITGRPYVMRMEPGSAQVTCISGIES